MNPRHALVTTSVVTIWGASIVLIGAGQANVPTMLFLALRFFIVCFPAEAFVKPPVIGWPRTLGIGLSLGLTHQARLYLEPPLGVPSGLLSILLQSQVVFAIVFAVVVLRYKPTHRQLIGSVLGALGISIVVLAHGDVDSVVPLIVALLSALAWTVGIILSRKAGDESGLSLVVWPGLVIAPTALAISLRDALASCAPCNSLFSSKGASVRHRTHGSHDLANWGCDSGDLPEVQGSKGKRGQ